MIIGKDREMVKKLEIACKTAKWLAESVCEDMDFILEHCEPGELESIAGIAAYAKGKLDGYLQYNK